MIPNPELFSLLDPVKMGQDFQHALTAGDPAELVRCTAAHFRDRADCSCWKQHDRSRYSRETARRAVQGDVTVIGIPHAFPGGTIDWTFNPTLTAPPVNMEWLWQLNRMAFWMDLAHAYEETGDETYAAAFDRQLSGWLSVAGDLTIEQMASCDLWRSIEAGLRMMNSWSYAFEVFRKSPSFTDENLCGMLYVMYRHCVYLHHYNSGGNWLLMEMTGIYTFGALFPEFQCSSAMRQYASGRFSSAILGQILPDGLHDELTPDYHTVMFLCAFAFYNIAQLEGIENEMPPRFLPEIERSLESVLAMATPGLTSPRTNDCFTCPVANRMRQWLPIFPHRLDFLWAATDRKEGHAPASDPASRFLPWAGFAVMRSGWDPEAAYCCFDVGPLGMAHAHQDKLNINIYKGAEELICDDGGGQYERSIYRRYGISAADHNTVLVDGLLQQRSQPGKVQSPIDAHWISTDSFDYAKGTYGDPFGPLVLSDTDAAVPLTNPAKHTREVRFFKPDFFCVQDTLTSADGKPHDYEMRLHLDTLKLDPVPNMPGAYLSDYGGTYDILILPLSPEGAEIRLLSGVDTNPMGGWFIGRNDKTCHRSTTFTMTVSGKRDHRFTTLLIPVRRDEPLPEIEVISQTCFLFRMHGMTYRIDPEHLSE